jgi:hypothetical protein
MYIPTCPWAKPRIPVFILYLESGVLECWSDGVLDTPGSRPLLITPLHGELLRLTAKEKSAYPLIKKQSNLKRGSSSMGEKSPKKELKAPKKSIKEKRKEKQEKKAAKGTSTY